MRKTILTISLAASAALADSYTLEEIYATGQVQKETESASSKTISKENIDKRVGAGQTNPYKALDMLPSVHTGQIDNYGLSIDQNSFRIRGLYADTYSRLALTADGVPSVVNVGQGAMGSILDMENIEAMDLTSGPSSADSGFGFGNNSGSLDMKTKKASDKFGMYLKQSYGSESFSRTFVRADTGKFLNGTKLFVSASHSDANKWRGPGDIKRDNAELGATIPMGESVKVDVLLAHNDIQRHDYMPLSYAQASDLDKNYNLDFNSNITGDARNDMYYYDFNRQHFKENLAQANIEAKLYDGLMSLKPYHIDTDGYRYSFNKSGTLANQQFVNRVDMTQNQYGVVARYDKNILGIDTAVGYWYQSIESIPPPTSNKSYNIINGQLVFKTWNMLTDVGEREFHSPFLSLKKNIGNLNIQAGIRYIEMRMPEIQGYTTTAGDVSYDAAMAKAAKDPDLHVSGINLRETLPSLNLKYKLNKDIDLLFDYTRGYANPWNGPIFSFYKSNKATFKSYGITLQSIWEKMKLETADQVDIGTKIKGDNWRVEPTLYYVKYDNKQVTAYDSVVKLSYYQSGAKAEAKGFELNGVYEPTSFAELFASVSFNELKFTNNIQTGSGSVAQTNGKQVPDAPKWLLKAGTTFRYSGFYASPAIKYVSKRYGDVMNTEYVAPYATVDMDVGYGKKNVGVFKELTASLSLQNLLGRKYIGIIKNDLDDTGTGSTNYYQGAPFAAIATVALKF